MSLIVTIKIPFPTAFTSLWVTAGAGHEPVDSFSSAIDRARAEVVYFRPSIRKQSVTPVSEEDNT